MAKTEEPNDKERICPVHSKPLKYSKKLRKWYCPECLYSSYLTHQAQQEAVKRYRQSEKGKESERKYELSEKGLVARGKYLTSEKYKQRRREYNARLKESLQIARMAREERATTEKEVEVRRTSELMPLIQDIHEYTDIMGRLPSPLEVVVWARDAYKITLPLHNANELLKRSQRKSSQRGD